MCMSKGWKNESERHSLSAKGIKTVGSPSSSLVAQNVVDGNIGVDKHLNIEQIVYIPSTFDGEDISSSEMLRRVEEVETFLAGLFGGYTSVESDGGWVEEIRNDEGVVVQTNLIKEPVVRVICYCGEEDYNNYSDEVFKFLDEKIREWKQDALSYELEGDLYLLELPKKNG